MEVDLHQLHKRLWKWLYDNPEKTKQEWPEWAENGGKISRSDGSCFACVVLDIRLEEKHNKNALKQPYHEDDDRHDEFIACRVLCPLKWKNKTVCDEGASYWHTYLFHNELLQHKEEMSIAEVERSRKIVKEAAYEILSTTWEGETEYEL